MDCGPRGGDAVSERHIASRKALLSVSRPDVEAALVGRVLRLLGLADRPVDLRQLDQLNRKAARRRPVSAARRGGTTYASEPRGAPCETRETTDLRDDELAYQPSKPERDQPQQR